jgi:hypothetical protein
MRAGPVFASTMNVIVPLPVPLEGATLRIHGVVVEAVYAQPLVPVSMKLPPPPAAATIVLVGLSTVEQDALWRTLNVCPPMVMFALRAAPGLLATV